VNQPRATCRTEAGGERPAAGVADRGGSRADLQRVLREITRLDTIVRRSLRTTQLYLDDVRLPRGQSDRRDRQALGGYSQLPEFDIERYFREAKHAMVGGGTNEIQYSIIAKEMGL
jgi:alkylation response protein AidB-like acyl-CoA dehydrogenase